MTDSLAYFVASVALYLVVLAVERPTWRRQLAVPAIVALAYLVRPQFVVLYPAYLLALATTGAVRPGKRLARLWPTAVSLALGMLGAVALVARRGADSLGDYAFLWRSYDLGGVLRWSEYHAADLTLYLGLIPIVLLPPALVAVHRRAKNASRPHAAVLAVFWPTTVLALLAAGIYASTPAVQDRLYDRYLFFLVPLWLVLGAVWLHEGAPRGRGAPWRPERCSSWACWPRFRSIASSSTTRRSSSTRPGPPSGCSCSSGR